MAAMSCSAHFKSSWETWTGDHVVNKGSQELMQPAPRAGFSKLISSKQEGRKHKWKRIKMGLNSLSLEEASLIGNALLPGIYNHFSCNCLTGRQISSPSPVLPTDLTVLLQMNMSGNHLYLLLPSSQGKQPAAPSEAQTHFSSVPYTYWKSNFLGWKLYLMTSYQRRD